MCTICPLLHCPIASYPRLQHSTSQPLQCCSSPIASYTPAPLDRCTMRYIAPLNHRTKRSLVQFRHYTITPLHHCTITPLHHYTITTLHHYTIRPLYHYTITPLRHYTITPLHHYTITPLRHYTITPLPPPWGSSKPQVLRHTV